MMRANFLNSVIAALLIVMGAASFTTQAVPFSLKTIRATEAASVDNGLATVAMIYQPDCPWCKKQGEVLTQAFEQCHDVVNIVLVGTRGNKRQLKKELKHYHKELPSFLASRQFLRSIGGYQASPTTLIYDEHGRLLKKKRGFIAEDKLANAFDVITRGSCQLELAKRSA